MRSRRRLVKSSQTGNRAGCFRSMRELMRSSLLVLGARVLGVALQAAILVLLARALPLADMGVVSFVLAGMALMRALGPLGLDQAVLRRMAAAHGAGDDGAVRALSGRSIVLVAAISGALAVSGGVGLSVARVGLAPVEIAAIALAMPAYALAGLLVAQVRALGYNLAAQLPESLGLQLAIGAGLWVAMGEGLDRADVLVVIAAAALLVTIVYALLVLRLVPRGDTATARLEGLFGEAFSILQALAVTALSVRLPVLLAPLFLGFEGAAIVDIAMRFGTLASLATSSVAATLSPSLSQAAARSDWADVRRQVRHGGVLAGGAAALFLVAILLLAPVLVGRVLPADYAAALVPMALFAVASLLNAAFGLASTAYLMAQRAALVRTYTIMGVLLFLVIALLSVSSWGAAGMGAAGIAQALVRDGALAARLLGNRASTN